MSGAKFLRFRHNDMIALEERLRQVPQDSTKLVIADAVFSMDGDIIDLPAMVALCKKYNAWLMIDEAHSLGVLGKNGRGIEEHFGMEGTIDIIMGTLSKTIPSVGGYIAGCKEMIKFLRHASRAYIFSAALPPAQAAAAKEAFNVILDEPWRIEKLSLNQHQFIGGLKARGFDTMLTQTAIVHAGARLYTQHPAGRQLLRCDEIAMAAPDSRLRSERVAHPQLDDRRERGRTTCTLATAPRRLAIVQVSRSELCSRS